MPVLCLQHKYPTISGPYYERVWDMCRVCNERIWSMSVICIEQICGMSSICKNMTAACLQQSRTSQGLFENLMREKRNVWGHCWIFSKAYKNNKTSHGNVCGSGVTLSQNPAQTGYFGREIPSSSIVTEMPWSSYIVTEMPWSSYIVTEMPWSSYIVTESPCSLVTLS